MGLKSDSVAVLSCCRYCTPHTPCCRINKLLTSILAPAVEASSPDGVRLALKIQKRHDEEAGVTGPSIGREQVKYAISARNSGAQHSPAQSGPVTGGPKLEEERTGRLPAHTPAPRAPTCKERAPINNFPNTTFQLFFLLLHNKLATTTRHYSTRHGILLVFFPFVLLLFQLLIHPPYFFLIEHNPHSLQNTNTPQCVPPIFSPSRLRFPLPLLSTRASTMAQPSLMALPSDTKPTSSLSSRLLRTSSAPLVSPVPVCTP